MTGYQKPYTPLPWPKGHSVIRYSDLPYANHAANAFPHLMRVLEMVAEAGLDTEAAVSVINALAIARGETKS